MSKYSIKPEDINPKVRAVGVMVRELMPYFDEEKFRKQNKILDKFLKGVWLSPSTNRKTVYLTRANGTLLRVLVITTKKRRKNSEKVTGLLWLHGGGYAIGLPEQDFIYAQKFCKDGSCIAVLPDYTRSTQAPYPAALEDSYLTLRWMWKHADELGINRQQIFVGGESAGGGLCAALCLYARDKGKIPIAFQMALYPMLDDRGINKSVNDNDAPVWNTKSNTIAWQLYLKDIYGTDNVPYYAAPARATDLSNLPPLCTFVGTIEPFYDETVAYCEALRESGVAVHFKEFDGCFHAFELTAYPTSEAKEARRFLFDTFRYAQRYYFSDIEKYK